MHQYEIAFVRCNGNRCNGTAYGSLQGGEACLYLAVRSVHRRRIGRWLGGAIRAHAEHSTWAIIAPHRRPWSRRALTPVAAVSGHQTQGRAPLLGSLNPEGSGVMHQPQPIHQLPVTRLHFTGDVALPFQVFHEKQKIPQGRRFC